MRKQLAMGAGIALVVGAVAVGCSSSGGGGGGGGFIPSSVDLNNGDNAPMSSIATNNLAADGAGFSSSNQNFVALQCKINKKPSITDGPATSADGSAVVAFQTSDQFDGHFRLYMSYFNGTTFTPPIEVTGVDRDEYAGAGGGAPDVTTGAILLIPINTTGYTGSANTTTGNAGATRANTGNWVIVWDATTFTTAPNTQQPSNTIANSFTPGGSGTLPQLQGQRITQNLQGAHRALYETVFLKSLATQPSAFSQALGTDAASGSTTSSAPSREYRYGFLVTAVQVTTLKRGTETGFTSGDLTPEEQSPVNTPPAAPNGPSIVSPAESVQSYGFVSDGLSGCALFGGSATPFSSTGGTNGAINATGATALPNLPFVEQPHTFLGLNVHAQNPAPNQGTVIANPQPGAPAPAAYAIGEDLTFVQLFWTQIVSSANSGDTATAMTPIQNLTDLNVHVGNRLACFRAGLNLRTLQFDAAPTEMTLPSTVTTEPAGQPLKAAISPMPTFGVYNQYVFMNYLDASIAHTAASDTLSNLQPFVTQNASVREFNTALIVWTAADNQDGTSTVGTTPTRLNVVPLTTLKPDNLDIDGFGNASTLNLETFGNQEQAGIAQSGGGCCVIGPDEGLGDTTVFFLERHSSAASVAADTNVDTELCAAVLAPNGTLQTGTGNPVVLSSHAGENTDAINDFSLIQNQIGHPNQGNVSTAGTNAISQSNPMSGTVFKDPVEGVSCCLNRSGTYALVTYKQWMGTSSGTFAKGLNAVVMQTFRFASSNGAVLPSIGTSGSFPPVNTRFAAGSGQQSNQTQPTGTNFANRIDIVGTTGQAISGQPGTPAPLVPANGITQLSSGEVNMPYQPNNPIVGTNNQPFFPTSTGVNSQAAFPCGYRCSFQSDSTLSNIMWEQSDSSEDRVYVRQIKVAISATNAAPTVTLGSSVGELEAGTQVTGDAIVNENSLSNLDVVVRTKYDFLEGDAAGLNNIAAGDLGVDSTGKGGGLLICYAKTTDGTLSDGTNYNRDVIAVQWDGAALSGRPVIDRGVFENSTGLAGVGTNFPASPFQGGGALTINIDYFQNTFGGAYNLNNNGLGESNVPAVGGNFGPGNNLHANLAGFVQVPANPSTATTTGQSLSPTESYLYMFDVNGDNADSGIGLYTRSFNHVLRATANNTATNLGDQFVPTAGTGPGSATFLQPQRLDHLTGGDVTGVVSINGDGTTATVLFLQDSHLWLSGTTDRVTQPYTNDGKGSADPFLVDNDTSAGTTFQAVINNITATTCGNLHGTIVFFGKNDLSQTNNFGSGSSANGGSGGPQGFAFRLRLRVFN